MVVRVSTLLTLIRHGETVWNREEKQQGILDSPLTESGIQQADATVPVLKKMTFDVVYSSPLGRALSTAEILNSAIGADIEVEDDLQERNLGILQGLTIGEFKLKFPEEFNRFATWDPDFVLPEGESSRQRYNRGNACIQRIADRQAGDRVLLVTHGGIIDGVFRRLFNIPLSRPRNYSLYNCAINAIEVDGGEWRLHTWGNISHLTSIGVRDDD